MRTVQATALSPLFLGGDPEAGNVAAGLDHVPGSVLRGALAARWIRDHGTPDHVGAEDRRNFARLFDGAIRFEALRPVGAVLVPLSVRRCKYDPVCDGSVDLLHEAGSDVCPVCGGGLDSGGRGHLIGGPALLDRTMTQLESDGTAKDKNLFSRIGLPLGTELRGRIIADDPWIDEVDGELVWFGGKRSAAGRVRLSLAPTTPTGVEARGDRKVALTLDAPAIVVDDAGRPNLSFPKSDLERILGVGVEVEREWVRPVRVGGWHAASGLPKPSEHAIGAGSSVLLSPAEPPNPERLAAVAVEGIGLRRNEGFGVVRVNPSRWTPSASSGSHAEKPEPAAIGFVDGLVDAMRREQPGDWVSELAWLLDIAKEAALSIEGGGEGLRQQVASRRRVRDWSQSLRDQVDLLADGTGGGNEDRMTFLEDAIILIGGILATERRRRP